MAAKENTSNLPEENDVISKKTTTVESSLLTDNPEFTRRRSSNAPKKGVIKQLIPLKIVIFLMYSGMAALYPFITLHMKSIGITLTETAIISFLLPILSCIGVPFAGALADKIGHYKILIIILTTIHVALHLLLLGVPPFREHLIRAPTIVDFMKVEFDCKFHDKAFFTAPEMEGVSNCTSDRSAEAQNELQFERCWSNCPEVVGQKIPSICFLNATSREDRELTKGHSCSKWTELEGQVFKDTVFRPVMTQDSGKRGSWELTEYRNDEGGLLHAARCLWEAEESTSTPKCSVSCQAASTAELICSTIFHEGNHLLTLLAYFFLRLFGLIALMSVFVILDTATLGLTLQHGGTFVSHRIFAALAFVALPPLSGFLVGGTYADPRDANFLPAFLIFGVFNIVGAIIVLCMPLPTNLPRKSIWQNLGKVLKQPQVIAVLCVMFIIGMAQGYSAGFLYWFLEDDLSAPKWLLGVGAAVANFMAIPFFAVSHKMIPKIGYANLLILVLLMNFGRFVAYSYLWNAYMFPAVEILTAFTICIVYTVPAHYSQTTAPKYASTSQALINAITFGLGFGVGPLIGGYLISWTNYRLSFQIFSLIFLVAAIIFAILFCFCLKKLKSPAPARDEIRRGSGSVDSNWSLGDLDWEGDSAMLYREKAPPTAEFEPDLWTHKFRPLSTDSWRELKAQGFIFPKTQKSTFV